MNETPFCVVKSETSAKNAEKHLSYRCTGAPAGLAAEREVKIFPPGKEILLKDFSALDARTCTVALKGIGAKGVRPGAVILPLWACGESAEVIYGYLLDSSGRRLHALPHDFFPGADLESPGFPAVPGTGKRQARVRTSEGGMRLLAGENVLACPGVAYRLKAEESGDILQFVPVLSGGFPPAQEKRIIAEIRKLPAHPERSDIWNLRLSAIGYSAIPPDLKTDLQKADRAGEILFLSGFAVKRRYLEELREQIIKLISRGEDVSLSDLAVTLGIERGLVKEVAAGLIAEGKIRKEGSAMLPVRSKETGLSPAVRRFRDVLEKRGMHGIDLREPDERKSRPFAETLAKRDEALFLDENFVISVNAYRALSAVLSAGKKPGAEVTVQEAREKLDIPRRTLPALLNRMEADGMLERDGDTRRLPRKTREPRRRG